MSNSILKTIRNILKFGNVKDSDDSGDYPKITASFFDKEGSALNIMPYGLFGRAPDGSLAVIMNIGGMESNQGAISNDYKNRINKNVEKGESGIENSVAGTYIKLNNDGSVDIFTKDGLNLEGDLNVSGDITATGNVEGAELQLTGGLKPYSIHVHGVTTAPGTTSIPQ